MTTLANIRDDIRNRLVETTADFYTNAELLVWINYSIKRFIQRTEWLERMRAQPLVANQYEYTLPTDVNKIVAVRYRDQYDVEPQDMAEWFEYVGTFQSTGVPPQVYRQFPWDHKIRIYPIPSAASASTTVTGAHNDTVTTITVGDTTSFPTRGTITINGSEQVRYTAKTATTFTGCIRGDGGTTAASYTGTEAVRWAELEVYYTYSPTALSSDSDVLATPSMFDETIVDYVLSIALQKRDKYALAEKHFKKAEDYVTKALEDRTKANRDKYPNFKDVSMEL